MDSRNASAANALRAIPERPAHGRIVINGYRAAQGEEKWRLLLPGASGPRLTELNPSGL